MFFINNLQKKAEEILQIARSKNLKIVTAESCTGGLLAGLFTEISGAADVFERGFVVYSNQAKSEMLEVRAKTLDDFGAVSEETAREMVVGALKNSHSDIAVAITGIAGPTGGSEQKPVGLVYVGVGCEAKICVRKFNFAGDRGEVRKATLVVALRMVEEILS